MSTDPRNGVPRAGKLAVICARCGTPVVHRAGAEAPACPKCPPEPLNTAEFFALREIMLRVTTSVAQIPTDVFERFIATHQAAVAEHAADDPDDHRGRQRELRVMQALHQLRRKIALVATEEARDALQTKPPEPRET